jgi:GT2 family glycosyltransferase
MSKPSVCVIIVSRSDKHQLARCLEFVFAQDYDGTKDIVVVDNASDDNSLLVLTSQYPQVKLVKNDVNLGIGTALNQGMAKTDSEYIAVLHQDTEPQANWMSQLVKGLQNHRSVGAACSIVTKRILQGARLEVESAGIAFRGARAVPLYQGDDPAKPLFREVRRVFGAPGAGAIYKREMLEKVKVGNEIFDEDLVAHGEEFDIALRAFLAGFTTLFVPYTSLFHKKGSLYASNPFETKMREIYGRMNPLLILAKGTPAELYDKHRKKIKKIFRQEIIELGKQFGVGASLRAWVHHRTVWSKMIKKQRIIFNHLKVKPSAIELEVFGKL